MKSLTPLVSSCARYTNENPPSPRTFIILTEIIKHTLASLLGTNEHSRFVEKGMTDTFGH